MLLSVADRVSCARQHAECRDGGKPVDENLRVIAELLSQRNALDERIGSITGRPMTAGHLGEWIASRIFDIELEQSAAAKGMTDGSHPARGRDGPSTSSGTSNARACST